MKVIACLAATLDGKIAYNAPHERARFNSEEDLQHLFRVRDLAEATLVGGETFRAYPRVHPRISQPKFYPHCIITTTWNLPLESPLFQEVLETPTAPRVRIYAPVPPPDPFKKIQEALVWIAIPPVLKSTVKGVETAQKSMVSVILADLKTQGIKTLLVEGGGEIISVFLQAQAIDEFHLTLCPTMIGGLAPALVGGVALSPSLSPQFKIASLKQVENEIFLHLIKS